MRHCWGSYLAALYGVIRAGGWEAPLRALHADGIPVLLADGACDPLMVKERASELAACYDNVATAVHPTAGHQLPITHPTWCADRFTQAA
jgi:pimeloyl-ACP methyl ester carboxylesterase